MSDLQEIFGRGGRGIWGVITEKFRLMFIRMIVGIPIQVELLEKHNLKLK